MANEIIRQNLLFFLAQHYETEGQKPASIRSFCAQYDVPFEQIHPILGMLHNQGVLKTVMGEEHATITPEGYRTAKPSDPSVPKNGGTHINFNAPVSGSAISFDSSSATVNNILTHENILQKFATAIESLPDVPKEKKASWTTSLLEMSKHPLAIEAITALFKSSAA